MFVMLVAWEVIEDFLLYKSKYVIKDFPEAVARSCSVKNMF